MTDAQPSTHPSARPSVPDRLRTARRHAGLALEAAAAAAALPSGVLGAIEAGQRRPLPAAPGRKPAPDHPSPNPPGKPDKK